MPDDLELLARDVAPAEVAMPDGSVVTNARVFVTTHRIYGYRLTGGQVVRFLDAELVEHGSVPRSRGSLQGGALEAKVADGSIWINRGRGCNCNPHLSALSSPVAWDGTRR